jgi:hypothetical protein
MSSLGLHHNEILATNNTNTLQVMQAETTHKRKIHALVKSNTATTRAHLCALPRTRMPMFSSSPLLLGIVGFASPRPKTCGSTRVRV